MYFITSIWIVRRLLRKGWVLSFCLQNLFASITFQAFATWRKYVDIQPLLDVTSCHRFNEPLKKALLELEFRALFLPLKVFFNNYLIRYTRKVTLTRVHLSCLLSCFPSAFLSTIYTGFEMIRRMRRIKTTIYSSFFCLK